MTSQGWLSTGAILGAAAVGLGAFGAHGLKSRVTADLLAVFETAARYHLVHALAIVAVAWVVERHPGACATAAGWLFLAGIVLFSGSLYALVLTGVRGLGAITPLGGLLLIAGWILLALAPFAGARGR
ncbi:MAG TPA: DUF423 domain-containing protein [Candidatus Polarisedimenticolia bacterium]|nr:DUF423 domain-containing protein [Candidatus Polarisedimenticolia bacterium]